MISLITWQHLNVYSYKLKNNVCVISIFHLYEAKKKKKKKLAGKKLLWQVVKKLTSGPGCTCTDRVISINIDSQWSQEIHLNTIWG